MQTCFTSACESFRQLLPHASDTSLAMFLWALATNASHTTPTSADGPPSTIAPVVIAVKALSSPPLLLEALIPRVHAALGRLGGREMSNVLWALAVLPGDYDAGLFDGAAEALMRKAARRPATRRTALQEQPDHNNPERDGERGGGRIGSAEEAASSGGEDGGSTSSGGGGLGVTKGGWRELKRQMRFRQRVQGLRAGGGGGGQREEPLLSRLKPLELAKVAWAYAKVRG